MRAAVRRAGRDRRTAVQRAAQHRDLARDAGRLACATSRRCIRSRSRWGSSASATVARSDGDSRWLPGDHRGRHQRQGLDLRDARIDASPRRLPRGAVHVAASRCASTSASASNGDEATDEALVAAFERSSSAPYDQQRATRSPTSNSARSPRCGCSPARALDVVVLEVGLGGRLDAVNIVDADVAVVTAIDIDHVDYLGATARRSAAKRRASSAPASRRSAATRSAALAGRARGSESARRCGSSAAISTITPHRHAVAIYAGPRQPRSRRCLSRRCAAPTSCQRGGGARRARGVRERLPVTASAMRDADWSTSSCRAASRCCPGARRWCSTSRTTRKPRARSRNPRRDGLSSRARLPCSACWPTRTSKVWWRARAGAWTRWYIAPLPGPRGATAARIVAHCGRPASRRNAVANFDTSNKHSLRRAASKRD